MMAGYGNEYQKRQGKIEKLAKVTNVYFQSSSINKYGQCSSPSL